MGEKIMDGFPSREEALTDFFAAWKPSAQTTATELVSLDEAIGRITARDLVSANTLPVVRASSCDGIAVKSTAFAEGLPDTSTWKIGEDYVRADTGDDFPDDYDAVIMIEKVVIQPNGSVILDNDVQVQAGTNVRDAGDTIKAGTPLIEAGRPIRPTDLAALAMGGITLVPVRRKPRIAFIPTGSELIPAGIAPRRGQNVDTNSLMVKHMLIEYGAEPLIFPIVHDDPSALEAAFSEALAVADAVVVNGGSAVGEEDFNVRMIEARGRVIHHYIAAVPGRPLMMAVADEKPVIDLPGPTLAAYYGTQWCLQAIVARFLGVPVRKMATVQARSAAEVSGPQQMANIARVNLVHDKSSPTGYTAQFLNFKSGDLAACMASNAQRISPLGERGFAAGDLVEVDLLRGEEFIN
ncbi:MAG: molybdopterin molybdotransferase MoeA [Gordonibacter sp.]|nr:molybdopterin molybdotransferase MoeA [Gordonibacter sp.]